MKSRIKNITESRFNKDLIWNAGAFGMISVIGVLINIVILNVYDASALGVFNQVYAIYIMLSQIAVGGVHLSVQAFIPKYAKRADHAGLVLYSALLHSVLSSVAVIFLCYAFADYTGKILGSPQVSDGFRIAAWGLLFFSMNKVMLAYFNGVRRMKVFAFFQLMRFVLMFAILMVLVGGNNRDSYRLCVMLSVSEAILFLFISVLVVRSVPYTGGLKFKAWMKRNFKFGNRALAGNFLLDINTRVDVFILGIFLSDKMVGIYSFASTIAEGFMQLPVLFRNNINPVITDAYARGKSTLKTVLSKNSKAFYKILSPLAALSILAFPIVTWVSGVGEDGYAMWVVYAILIGSVVLTSGFLPFVMIFNQIGRPHIQTYFIFWIFLSNLVFNLIFVPWMGIYGAALGTALSFVMQVFIMKAYLKPVFAEMKNK